MAFKAYKSYNFVDKDPVLDLVRVFVEDSHKKLAEVSRDSGVSNTTLYNWFGGKTRRPMFSTIAAVARSCGKDITLGGITVVTPDEVAARRGRKKAA